MNWWTVLVVLIMLILLPLYASLVSRSVAIGWYTGIRRFVVTKRRQREAEEKRDNGQF